MDQATAGKIREELNRGSKDLQDRFYGQIALFSAGAISLSITYLGFVADKPKVLSANFLCFPAIDFLYTAWIFLIVSLLTALFSREADANYMDAFGATLASGVAVQGSKDASGKVEQIHTENKAKTEKHFGRMKFLRLLSRWSFLGGILLIVVYAVLSSLALLS